MTAPDRIVSDPAWQTCAIACLRAPYDPEAAAQARSALSDPSFNWHGFVQFVHNQRIAPIVHQHIGSWGLFPQEVETSLRRAYLYNDLLNARRLEALHNLLDTFAAASIPVTLLKGVALLHTIYTKSALRPMNDMDLLIPKRDMEKAIQCLLSRGYDLVSPASISKEFVSEIAFEKPGSPPWHVDLHSSLFNAPHRPSTAQMNWFLGQRIAVEKDGWEVFTFSPLVQLLHLSGHLWLHHGGGDLLGLNDIYQVIRQNHECIDWEQVLATGGAFELLLPLKKVLPELAAQWKSPVPEEILAKLSQARPTLRETRKFGKFWGDDHNIADTLLAYALSYPDWPTRLRFLWTRVFPPPGYIRDHFKVRTPLLIPYFYTYRLAARAIQQIGRAFRKQVGQPPDNS